MDFFKTTLGRTISVLVAVFLVLLSIETAVDAMRSYRDQSEAYKKTIYVSAEGKVQAVPDIAKTELSVVSRGNTVAAVTTENTRKMNAVIAALKGMNIEEKDIRSTSYYLAPQYDYTSSINPPRITGYSLEQGVEVKIRKIEQAGEIIQKATDTGANQVGQINFTIDDSDALKSQAREEAFRKAKEKAEVLASQAGVRLGKIVTFSEYSDGYMPYPADTYYREAAMSADGGPKMGGGMPAPSPTLQPGSQEVIAGVSVTYEIY